MGGGYETNGGDRSRQRISRVMDISRANLKVGDVIKIGQVIGAVGSTAVRPGPQLHYETRIDWRGGRSAKSFCARRSAQRRLEPIRFC